MSEFEFKINTAGETEIFKHLKTCDQDFQPELSSRVNLEEYAKKVASHAVTFEAWNDNLLGGLVGTYFNDPEAKTAFVTTVSTMRKFTGLAIGTTLMTMCKEYGQKNGFENIQLEVQSQNLKAISIYEKLGFQIKEQQGDQCRMTCSLKPTK